MFVPIYLVTLIVLEINLSEKQELINKKYIKVLYRLGTS